MNSGGTSDLSAKMELERILRKWANEDFPQSYWQECLEAIDPLQRFLLIAIESNMQHGVIDRKETSKIGERLGEVLGHTARSAFFVGLEYASTSPLQEISDEFISSSANQALPVLTVASDPSTKMLSQLVGALGTKRTISEQQATQMGQDFGKLQLTTQAQCFELGMRFYHDRARSLSANEIAGTDFVEWLHGQANMSSKEELLKRMQGVWETDRHHYQMMAGQLSGMVYELFGDSPGTMPLRDRRLLKIANDLEAELIRLENKAMAMSSGFTPLIVVTRIEDGSERQALEAIAEYAIDLAQFAGDILPLIHTAHELALDLRSDLLEKGH